MATETMPAEKGGYEVELDAGDLTREDKEYILDIGAAVVDAEYAACFRCRSRRIENFALGLPSGRAVNAWRCGHCGSLWVMDRANGTPADPGALPRAVAELAGEARLTRQVLREPREEQCNLETKEERVRLFIRELNGRISERGVPFSKAERDAILAAALPAGPEEIGLLDDIQREEKL